MVRDPALRIEAVAEVARDAAVLGLETRGVVASPLPGPAGNVEYFIWLHKPADVPGGMSAAADKVGDRSAPVSAQPVGPEIMAMIVAAVEAGPR